MDVSVIHNLEDFRNRILDINETLFLQCSKGRPEIFIGPDDKNRHDFDYFCRMGSRGFRTLIGCLDPYRTWFHPAPIKRSDFYQGLNFYRTNTFPKVHVSTLEFDYWQAVHDAAHSVPECAGLMFGLEPWFVASLLENDVKFKEILFIVTSYCRASYIFNLVGIDFTYGRRTSIAILRANFRLSFNYTNPSPAGRFGQGSAFL